MKSLLTLLSVFVSVAISAQVLIPSNTRADVSVIKENCTRNKGVPSKEIMDRFAVYLNKGVYYVSFLGEKKEGFLRSSSFA